MELKKKGLGFMSHSASKRLVARVIGLGLFLLCNSVQSFSQGFPIQRLSVNGNSRLPSEGILTFSGLRLGQVVVPGDFQAASDRMLSTGLFQDVKYRYQASRSAEGAPGYDLVFQVEEITQLGPVRLDIPGMNETELWDSLRLQNPAIDRRMPASEPAINLYRTAIEQILREKNRNEEIVDRIEADPFTRETIIVFRPAKLPIVKEIHFQGNHYIENEVLQKTLSPLAVGFEYTEHSFRQLLDYNIRPLYEQQGRLRIEFSTVSIGDSTSGDGLTVAVAIKEGESYRLGNVVIVGDDLPAGELLKTANFPKGELANWRVISESLHEMEAVLRNSGYLALSSTTKRNFDDGNRVVALEISMKKGPQFYFGELHLSGLDKDAETWALSQWKLLQGAPMNAGYVNLYLKGLIDAHRLANVTKTASELKIRPQSTIMDVFISFR